MAARLLFGAMLLFASLCWGIEQAKTKLLTCYPDIIEYKKHNQVDEKSACTALAEKYKKDIKIIDNLLLEIADKKNPNKDSGGIRICEQTLMGDDWLVFLERSVVLRPKEAASIPSRQWKKFNCEISYEVIKNNHVKITIIPDIFPALGEHRMADATWKAVVWLEASSGSSLIALAPDESRAQLDLCQGNLELEAKMLRQKLGEIASLLSLR